MSTFSAALGVLGLSIQEAARYLDLPPSEVERLCTYGSEVTEGTWAKLANLYAEVLTGASIGGEQIWDFGLQLKDLSNFEMGHAGMPDGPAAAAGAIAVLDFLRQLQLGLGSPNDD